jgi:DNA polymerase-3 subunit gamma/tau
VDILRQAWPNVLDAVKAKGRVAAIVVGNASVASFDEGVLTLRFPRQGDVKGFLGSKYEDLLKQALNSMFGVNVGIRAVTGGGDAPPTPTRRQPPGPGSGAGPAQGSAAPPSFSQAAQPPTTPEPENGAIISGGAAPAAPAVEPPPPLPPPPADDDEDYEPDYADMSSSTTVNDITGMALIQRELGAQIIAEYDD